MSTLQQTKWDRYTGQAVYWSFNALATAVWLSTLLFGVYIFFFYVDAYLADDLSRWNTGLSTLYIEESATATTGMGLHFLGGAVLLFLGSVQFIELVRLRYPIFHRWVGRVYVGASMLTAVGGFTFIIVNGTIGGTVMNIGFSVYGILMFGAAIETARHARGQRFEQHRAWALRLFALAIGSWLYRIEYAVWYLLTDGLGGTSGLTGPFDQVMTFFFFIPNLIIVELWLRARPQHSAKSIKAVASLVFMGGTLFLLYATYVFASQFWFPAIFGTAS